MDHGIHVTCERCEQVSVVHRRSMRSAAALHNALPEGWVVRREPKGTNGRMMLTVYCPLHAEEAPGRGPRR